MDPSVADLYRMQDFSSLFSTEPYEKGLFIGDSARTRSVEFETSNSVDETGNANEEKITENSFVFVGDEFGGEEIVVKCTEEMLAKFLDYGSIEGSWKIQLVNVEEFANSLSIPTLSFIRVDPDILAQYQEYFAKMNKFYSGLRKLRMGHLRLNRIRRGNLAVLDLGDDRGFARVQIDEDYDPSHHFTTVKLLDYNTLRWVDPKNLFYATDLFTNLPYQTNELTLLGTAEYNLALEFREAIREFVQENSSIFRAQVVRINKHNVAIVKLIHKNFPMEIANENFVVQAIRKFKPERFPEAGEVRSKAYVIHFEENGTIHVQFTSYQAELCRREVIKIPADEYEQLRTTGPYPLNKTDVYLAIFADDGFIYRAMIVDMSSRKCVNDKVVVYFMDYGNTELIPKSDLIPARLLSSRLPHFPPQVVKARVINLRWIRPSHMSVLVKPDKMLSVETIIPGTWNKLPYVELFIYCHGELVHFSHDALEKSSAHCREWKKELLWASTERECKFDPLETIDMKGVQWKNKHGQPTELREGVTLDILIGHSASPDEFYIQPFGIQDELADVETQLNTYNTVYTGERWSKAAEIALLVDSAFCSLYLPHFDTYVRVKLPRKPCAKPKNKWIKVLLVDYGQYVQALKKNLRPISLQACKLPSIGALASLNSALAEENEDENKQKYEPKEDPGWTDNERLNFGENVCGKRFLFNVTSIKYDKNERLFLKGNLYVRPMTSALETIGHVKCLRKITPEDLLCPSELFARLEMLQKKPLEWRIRKSLKYSSSNSASASVAGPIRLMKQNEDKTDPAVETVVKKMKNLQMETEKEK